MTSDELLSHPLMNGGEIANLMVKISATSSRSEKEGMLDEFMNSSVDSEIRRQGILEIFQDTFGPAKYNIKNYQVTGSGTMDIDHDYSIFRELLGRLTRREITGNEAREEVGRVISMFNPASQIILARILDKNMRVGIGSVYAGNSGATSKFPVRLANSWKDVSGRVDVFDGSWLVSRKLDGCRLLAFIHSSDGKVEVEFRSRQNKIIHTLSNLKGDYEVLFRNHPGDYVVDGEACILDAQGNESFHGLMSEIGRKNHTIERPCHIIYDFLQEDEFWGNTPSPVLSVRLRRLSDWLVEPLPHLQILPQTRLHHQGELDGWLEVVKEKGWEGLMLAKDVPYKGKRSNDLLKVKEFKDAEFVVSGVITGIQARNTESGSSLVETTLAIQIPYKGNVVSVGSGLSFGQRDEWYADPSKIIGKTVCIQYFEETVDKKTGLPSLRFPTLKYVYEHGRNY